MQENRRESRKSSVVESGLGTRWLRNAVVVVVVVVVVDICICFEVRVPTYTMFLIRI